MYKINDIRKKLFQIGIDITSDQIRGMEKKGLFSSSRNKAGYRQYTPEQMGMIVTNIILYKIGFDIDEIRSHRGDLVLKVNEIMKKLA